MTKQQLLEQLKSTEETVISQRRCIDELNNEFNKEIFEKNKEISDLNYNLSNRTKDLEIMQITINDVEEKNRDLNVKILELRKALKTVSQYL